jgi:hypothetical protein
MNTQSWQSWQNTGFGEIVRANSIPLAMIGIGIAWLAANTTGLADRLANDERVQAARRRIGEFATDMGISGASGTAGPAASAAAMLGPDGNQLPRTSDKGRSEGWVHQAAGAARGAIGSVRGAGSAALDHASDYAGNAGDLAKRASDQVADRLNRDPWLVGVVGLVAGALVAALVPPTRIEQECVSDARDDLWNRATELGHDAAERVRELADSTIRASRQ